MTSAHGPGWELHCGRWQDALAGVDAVDAVICDPPYSARTHDGHNNGVSGGTVARQTGATRRPDGGVDPETMRRAISYAPWAPADVSAFVAAWSGRCSGWFAALTSHDLCAAWIDAFEAAGRYAFAPLACLSPGSRVRLGGDGPSNWAVWLVVARPREKRFASWGTLPGGYITPPESMPIVGGKPLGLMRAIVRDYSRPGDLVVDPCAGGGTTLLAAAMEGRRAVGSEMDPDTYAKAVARLRVGIQPDMFTAAPDDERARAIATPGPREAE